VSFKSRRIFKTINTCQHEIEELLQFLFVGELLSPSDRIWIVTPWISNVPILDNRNGVLSSLDPTWGKRKIRLIEILLRLMNIDVEVMIVTRPDEHCKRFLANLNDVVSDYGVQDRVNVFFRKELHTKGVLTKTNMITGSMNLTYNGLFLLDESVIFDTDPQYIGQTRLNFEKYLDE